MLTKILLAILLPFVFNTAEADTLTYRDEDGDTISLYDRPCTHEASVNAIPASLRSVDFFAVESVIGGQRFSGCWRRVRGDMAHIVWEDGDQGVIPMSQLRRATDT